MSFSLLEKIDLVESNKKILFTLSLLIGFFFLNLDALVDTILQPEVAYFSPDHVVVGTATGLFIFFITVRLTARFRQLRASESALRDSEQRLITIFDTLPDGIILTSLQGTIRRISSKALRLSGFESENEAIGRSLFEFLAPEDRDRAAFLIGEMLKGNYTGASEYSVRHKDGSFFTAEVNAEVMRDKDGNPSELIFVERDVTVRKQMEEDREAMLKDLQMALADTTHLEGVVPICSSCKKIRDEEGIWNILESYLTKHTGAQFSHGICPDCLQKYRSELQEMKSRNQTPIP